MPYRQHVAQRELILELRERVAELTKINQQLKEELAALEESPLEDDDGNVIGISRIVRDITQQKRNEGPVRASEKQYRTLVENAPVCIHEIDLDGRFTSMNRAGLRMVGAEQEDEVVGKDFLDAVCASDRKRVAALLASAFAGQASHFEFTSSESLGSRYFSSSFIPLKSPDGKTERLMGITEDVTQHEEFQRELRDRNERYSHSGVGGGERDYLPG